MKAEPLMPENRCIPRKRDRVLCAEMSESQCGANTDCAQRLGDRRSLVPVLESKYPFDVQFVFPLAAIRRDHVNQHGDFRHRRIHPIA
jgi:hypothetical protein